MSTRFFLVVILACCGIAPRPAFSGEPIVIKENCMSPAESALQTLLEKMPAKRREIAEALLRDRASPQDARGWMGGETVEEMMSENGDL